ncbi:MAG: hypothetical protein D6806_01705 [Deltaproteobacteria bacterium]|nr:MAG: hypothetical protein D6806_01705 [Deltaproteobacteria bacterium]
MKRTVVSVAVAAAALAATVLFTGCGGGCGGICGSQCELISCSYDTLKCDLYPDPNRGIVIHYLRKVEGVEGYRWTARLFIDTSGIDPVEGHMFEGQEFLDRVMLTRPQEPEPWPDYDGKDCTISSGGDSEGHLAGQCNFRFTNGYFATFNFSCDLKLAEPNT